MKKKIIGVVIFVLVVAALALVYNATKDNVQIGTKNITIQLVDQDGKTEEYKLSTNAEYLQGAMNDSKIEYETADGMVMVVNGLRADYVLDGAYWCFYVNGTMCNFGIADQPVSDGDSFEIVYTRA